jgi:hypothetical protein
VSCYKAQRVDLFITRLSKIDIHLPKMLYRRTRRAGELCKKARS